MTDQAPTPSLESNDPALSCGRASRLPQGARNRAHQTAVTRGRQLQRLVGRPIVVALAALTVLAHKIARAVYFMLARQEAFDMHRVVTT
jgi:hypothetical protein